MSLTYTSEHLAWKQRIGQEKLRANIFYKTSGSFYPKHRELLGSPFPGASNDSTPKNYKSLNFNLGFTFGGTKHIKYALKNSPMNSVEKFRLEVEDSRKYNSPDARNLVNPELLKKYAEELKGKINEEKRKRGSIEKRLKVTS